MDQRLKGIRQWHRASINGVWWGERTVILSRDTKGGSWSSCRKPPSCSTTRPLGDMTLPRFIGVRAFRHVRKTSARMIPAVESAPARSATSSVYTRTPMTVAWRAPIPSSPILSMTRPMLWNANVGARPSQIPLGGVRFTTYGSEYQPSQRKRKRKHGFLARLKSRTGKKILIRRRAKGKTAISH